MYLDRFINDKYIQLMCYCIDLNKNNRVIVDFKYDQWNVIMYLRYATKGIQPYNVLTKLQAENNIGLYKSYIKLFLKNNLKNKYYNLNYNMYKEHIPFNIRRILNFRCIQLIKLKKKKFKKANPWDYKKLSRSYNLISVNVNLYKSFKKKRFFKFFLNKLLKKQVAANGRLLDGYLNLNLHVLFLRRFKLRFYEFMKKKKTLKKFNFNNFNLYFTSKVFPKIVNFEYLLLYLSKVKNLNIFYDLLYNKVSKKLSNFLTFNIDFKYLSRYKKYFFNIRHINYVNVSFTLNAIGSMNKKKKRKTRKFLRKYKKNNFFLFFNLAFIKLVIFVFLYWLNKFIVLINKINKGIIITTWFKPINYFYKIYFWRRKLRHFYLPYNSINRFVFLNYKNRLVKNFKNE
jgi:hypothetical protein